MPQPLSGPGVGLPYPQNLYPSALNNAPLDLGQNRISMAPGDALPLPAGDWYVDLGDKGVLIVQFLDPMTNSWRGAYNLTGLQFIKSDGFTVRIANLTGCPISAMVTLGGSSYVAASTTITANTGGSTWVPIVGGAATTASIMYGGLNYGVAPLLFVQAPPAPVSGVAQGVQATAVCAIANTSVSAVSIVNRGAGYIGASIPVVVLPSPYDPNLGSLTISQATVYLNTGYNGQLAAGIVTNNGAPATPTLTVGGAGSSATIGAVILRTLTGMSVTNGGAGFVVGETEISTVGGRPTGTPVIVNPALDLSEYRPRRASMLAGVVASGGVISVASTIFDGGLFVGSPGVIVNTSGAPTSAATIGLTLGSAHDTALIQPAP